MSVPRVPSERTARGRSRATSRFERQWHQEPGQSTYGPQPWLKCWAHRGELRLERSESGAGAANSCSLVSAVARSGHCRFPGAAIIVVGFRIRGFVLPLDHQRNGRISTHKLDGLQRWCRLKRAAHSRRSRTEQPKESHAIATVREAEWSPPETADVTAPSPFARVQGQKCDAARVGAVAASAIVDADVRVTELLDQQNSPAANNDVRRLLQERGCRGSDIAR